MVFSSIPFLFFFLPLFLIIYYIVPFKYKNYILLVFSLVFYAWGEPIYILLMLFTCFIDYLNGLLYIKKNNKKIYLVLAIVINLLLLTFFKYSDFLIGITNDIFNINVRYLNLALPIGISFYTFQSMSYSIDVYRGNVKPEKNYFRYLTYVSMFPQLIAGPIVRYDTISKELYKRKITFEDISLGFERFLIGLIKKVLLANNIGLLFTTIYNMPTNNLSVLSVWLGALSFTFQIYFDFSGYSDMAIGLGKMLGFNFLENFNYPYIAKSITDFWHRWHISLSTWFRDYLYIPLGGNRCSIIKNIRNILIVWALTGLWHGASYNFLLWGIYYGIILIIEKFILNKYIDKWPNIIKHIYSWLIIIIGWGMFSYDTNTSYYLKAMFGLNDLKFINNNFLFLISNYLVVFILCIFFSIPHKYKLKGWFKYMIYIVLFILVISSLVTDSYNPFLYFRF